ncbi:hypothetical protein YC2023_093552 [Brassica napus]
MLNTSSPVDEDVKKNNDGLTSPQSLTAHPVDEDVKKNYKCLTTPPHPVDEDVKKNNDSLTPHLQLMKICEEERWLNFSSSGSKVRIFDLE